MAKKDIAIFAAGCFWGVQDYFDKVPGVNKTTVGYTGGHTDHPTYEQVCSHKTGHAEATEIEFDPDKASFELLARHFFKMHDPTQINRQGPDIGDNYRSAIFYTSEGQHKTADSLKHELDRSGEFSKPIATEITAATHFWPAEEYHQKYTEKTGFGGCHIAYEPLK